MTKRHLHVGIVGAGLGGLAASIAIARSGATVTLLEQASGLGEIGAGIQIFPNFSRFLVRWDVVKHLQPHLVTADLSNTWSSSSDLKMIAQTDPREVVKVCGFPWWSARRDHLHAALTDSAKEHGVKLVIRARVVAIDDSSSPVVVTTSSGDTYAFDLVIGADGVKSAVRAHLFPHVQPTAPSKVAAYRGVLPYSLIYDAIPEAKHIFRNTMDFWTSRLGYVMTYPISGGTEMNIVTSFYAERLVTQVEDVPVEEFQGYYVGYPDILQKVLKLVKKTKRWPLLQIPRMERWSNTKRTVVLMGDAAHAMQNHVAQGAATAVEDGAFLGQVISEVVRGEVDLETAVGLYEERRIPKAWVKQQLSMMSGYINMLDVPEGWDSEQVERRKEESARLEVENGEECVLREATAQSVPPWYRGWQLYCSPQSNKQALCYDAEADADNAVCEYLAKMTEVDEQSGVSEGLKTRFWGNVFDNGVGGRQGKMMSGDRDNSSASVNGINKNTDAGNI